MCLASNINFDSSLTCVKSIISAINELWSEWDHGHNEELSVVYYMGKAIYKLITPLTPQTSQAWQVVQAHPRPCQHSCSDYIVCKPSPQFIQHFFNKYHKNIQLEAILTANCWHCCQHARAIPVRRKRPPIGWYSPG